MVIRGARGAVAAAGMLFVLAGPARAGGGEAGGAGPDSLRAVVEVLAAEVARLRDLVEEPDGGGRSGAGDAGVGAAKVYGAAPGVSLGGYGEFLFEAPTGAVDTERTADYYRFITYVGYKFSDRILMNTEIEVEHASTEAGPSGEIGAVSLEFSYLELALAPGWSVRAGNLLVPVGFVNRMHEPPFYRGNARPTVERRLLPTTWRELGAGIVAEPAAGWRAELYAVNGLDAAAFGPRGIRDGRQGGNHARWEDVAVTGGLDWTPVDGFTAGGGVFAGGAGQGRLYDGERIDGFVTVGEAHAELRRGPFRARGLVAATSIGDAARIAAEVGDTVPERQRGGYLEASWDVAGLLGMPGGQSLLVWGRREDWDLQHRVPGGAVRDAAQDGASTAVGVDYLPHPQVVIKVDWVHEENEADDDGNDPLRVGAGFVF